MKKLFQIGDEKRISFCVTQEDVASFKGEVVHLVCATFSLAREIEWATRQFVLEIQDEDEEGIGTFLSIDHLNPAFIGEEVVIESKIETFKGNELICSYTASVGDRIVSKGKTGQKIVTREKLKAIFLNR